MNKTYKTESLNEATYLVIKGFQVRIKRTGPVMAIFTFVDSTQLQSHVKKFWGESNIPVNLNKWLFIRMEMKMRVKSKEFRIKSVSGNTLDLKNGEPYYYKFGTNVLHALWGSAEIHQKRLKAGNVFVTRKEANKK